MKRSLLLATIFGALSLPAFADPAPMATGSGLRGVDHPSPIAGGVPTRRRKVYDDIPPLKPTPRAGDGRALERQAAEAEKIKSQQK